MKKLLIISKSHEIYSTKRLLEEANALNYQVNIVTPDNVVLMNDIKREWKGSEKKPDTIISRISAASDEKGLNILYYFETLGIPIINSYKATMLARNKFLASLVFTKQNIATPKAVFCTDTSKLDEVVSELNGFPLVIKLLRGAQGQGVMLAQDIRSLKSIVDSLLLLSEGFILQEYIEHEFDKRLIVLDNQVIASMKRYRQNDDFRTNIKCGGKAKILEPSDQDIDLALRATQALQLTFSGVDIIDDQVIEVNCSPGFEKIEEISQVNIARALVRSI